MEIEIEEIGTLSREYGYNGFKPLHKGTPIFKDGNRYFFVRHNLNGDSERLYFSDVILKDTELYF